MLSGLMFKMFTKNITCRSVIKYSMSIINLLYAICGLVIVIMGSVYCVKLKDATLLVRYLPYIFVALGLIVVLLSLSVSCSFMTENVWILVPFGVCMSLLAAIEIFLTVMLFKYQADIIETVIRVFKSVAGDIITTLGKSAGVLDEKPTGEQIDRNMKIMFVLLDLFLIASTIYEIVGTFCSSYICVTKICRCGRNEKE